MLGGVVAGQGMDRFEQPAVGVAARGDAEHLGQAALSGLCQLPTRDALGDRVHAQYPAVGIGGDEAGPDQVECG